MTIYTGEILLEQHKTLTGGLVTPTRIEGEGEPNTIYPGAVTLEIESETGDNPYTHSIGVTHISSGGTIYEFAHYAMQKYIDGVSTPVVLKRYYNGAWQTFVLRRYTEQSFNNTYRDNYTEFYGG